MAYFSPPPESPPPTPDQVMEVVSPHPQGPTPFDRLVRGLYLSFDSLVGIHDTLHNSRDALQQYAGAWALILASQKHEPTGRQRNVARSIAEAELDEIASRPVSELIESGQAAVPLEAALSRLMIRPMNHPGRRWSNSQRQAIYTSSASLLDRVLEAGEVSERPKGFLTELVTLSLLWRPSPGQGTGYNVLPANPAVNAHTIQDLRQFKSDLIAFKPRVPNERSSSVKIQVKTNLTKRDYKNYDGSVLLIGANTHFVVPDRPQWTGQRKAYFLARAMSREVQGIPLTDVKLDALNASTLSLNNAIHDKLTDNNGGKSETGGQKEI